MKLKQTATHFLAIKNRKRVQSDALQAEKHQERIRKKLLQSAEKTVFGKDHAFKEITNYREFTDAVPVRDYEELSPYIEKIREGQQRVLWKEPPLYWAKTSGTTSGNKYIPITRDSLPNHIKTARDGLFCYLAEKTTTTVIDGKMIFLSGSPKMKKENNIAVGRLSGIVHNHVPSYLQSNRLPSYATNCIEDWETKLDAIVRETIKSDMRLISGIPPWVQMYVDRLLAKSGKECLTDLFPNLSLFIHGGVNFKPYEQHLKKSFGGHIDYLETFPASEGFFAYQDTQERDDLLLNTNSGIFFEFIPLEEYGTPSAKRLALEDVQLGQSYAFIISSNAGLWAYDIGDVVEFTSRSPYRLIVKGRTKHFISAFGEHVIGEEVDAAMAHAIKQSNALVTEFTVAPFVNNKERSNSCHEWFVEFVKRPNSIEAFGKIINATLCTKNAYYKDLIEGNIISKLQVREMKKGTFIAYMRSIGKLGAQNKVPRLQNNRSIADHSVIQQGIIHTN